MGDGEHTIISKIPRERLNQIASRKLTALGIPVRIGPDRETLEGDLAFSGGVQHPATGQPIARARFAVVGHDQLRFLEPPLAALPPMPFYDADRLPAIEQRLATALQRRGAALRDLSARMRALRLEPAIDPDRMVVRAVVKTATHAFEILGADDGMRVSRIAPVGGKAFDVAGNVPAIPPAALGSPADLERHLANALPIMELARRPGSAPPPAEAARIEPMPPPRNALTLAALTAAFGDGAVLAPNAAVELIQEFQHGGTHYRFVASRDMGSSFRGRVIGPLGDVWSDHFDLAAFPGTAAVVAAALGIEGGTEPAAGERVPEHLLPHPGEVWVMNVLVEEAGTDEVRYVGTDIDGRPYGAARVLKRSDFEAVFTNERGGWRLLVAIDQVSDGNVVYRQLDRQRQPIGSPRRMATSILVANFVPEAAAY